MYVMYVFYVSVYVRCLCLVWVCVSYVKLRYVCMLRDGCTVCMIYMCVRYVCIVCVLRM